MSAIPSIGIPELAGLSDYTGAARVGFPVAENVRRMLRLHWAERRLMFIALAHLPATPEWEVKCALALHQWQDGEHANALLRRIAEMRSPAPRMDAAPDPALDAFLEEVLRARDTVELLAGIYTVGRRALAAAYAGHIARTNPLADQPTVRLMRVALAEQEQALAWGQRAVAALCARDDNALDRADRWTRHLTAYLMQAGGIAGDDHRAVAEQGELPPPRASAAFAPDAHPRRDARFRGQYDFDFPPHTVYNAPGVPADERNLALLCKRTLEMDVPEMIASIILERPEMPWEFVLDYSRQLWDEARHAMLGTVALEARGIDWSAIPLNVGFALRLNIHATPLERQVMLYGIEQTLMPGETGKRSEYETAVAAGDALSAHFHDYDWADEVLHARIGRRWMKHEGISPQQAIERGSAVHEKTWSALMDYAGRTRHVAWWGAFVRRVLGHESAVVEEEPGMPSVITE
ncbi:MAG: hypothetical protein ACRENI_13420 [Gemmatimonadaceae bacterium]